MVRRKTEVGGDLRRMQRTTTRRQRSGSHRNQQLPTLRYNGNEMITEEKFQELVAVWLSESFADVEAEVTLSTGDRPDYIASTPFASYVIEVENSGDEIRNGIGQVMDYYSITGYEPVVVVPADSTDFEELKRYQSTARLPLIETV